MPLIAAAYAVRRRLLSWLRWPTRGVKVAVYDREGRLLLVRHRYGRGDLWMLPGGGIGWREAPDVAARREVLEEVGCALTDLRFVATFVARAEGRRDTVHLFRAVTDDSPTIDGIEIAEAAFFAPDALPAATSAATRRRVEELGGTREPDGHW